MADGVPNKLSLASVLTKFNAPSERIEKNSNLKFHVNLGSVTDVVDSRAAQS